MIVHAFRHAWLFSLLVWCFFLLIGSHLTNVESHGSEVVKGIELQTEFAEGLPVGSVTIQLDMTAGDPEENERLKSQATAAFGITEGATFRRVSAEFGVNRIRQLDTVRSAELKLYKSVTGGSQVEIIIRVSPLVEGSTVPSKTKGLFASGNMSEFPTLFENDRSRFVFILNGGAGIFTDSDPWFGGFGQRFNNGNPTAEDPLGAGTSAWLEGYIEPGIGGIFQLYDYPLYPYGAVSYLMSGTSGHDIYNSGSRGYGDFEKLYAGLLWDLPGEKTLVDVSFGRQIYQIRDGFLLSKIPVSTSIGERAALYLGPRLTSEFTALAKLRAVDFGLETFFLEPSEISEIAGNTRLAGINLTYQFSTLDAALTYFYVPESKTNYRAPDGRRLSREGLRTINPSLSMTEPFGLDNSWIKMEYAYQNHEDYDMSAQAGYVWAGYTVENYSWQPEISYRWSLFSGDNPDTQTFERFDPLFSGGLGNFLPGIIFSKVYKNSNLITNRATLTVKPSDTLELSLDYFHHRADNLNNLGGIGPLQTLESKEIGQEVTLSLFHYVGAHLFLQGIASVGFPGEAIERSLGGDAENWYTVQAALYMFF